LLKVIYTIIKLIHLNSDLYSHSSNQVKLNQIKSRKLNNNILFFSAKLNWIRQNCYGETLLNQGSWRISAPRLWTMQGPGIAVEKRRDRRSLEAETKRANFHILSFFRFFVQRESRNWTQRWLINNLHYQTNLSLIIVLSVIFVCVATSLLLSMLC
jgi:hypothetical protein